MKNQYFGDFGDYQKFSLLKILRDIGGLKITVHWMKTADDSSSDGSKIKYLSDPATWSHYDRELFGFLKNHIGEGRRDLDLYESSRHAGDIRFVNDHIEEASKRSVLLETIKKDQASDLIFFDPDNGIEVASTNKKTVHKYVAWADIGAAFESGKSVLIYQHFSRQNRDVFIKAKLKEIRKKFPKILVLSIKVKNSVYFMLCHKRHAEDIQEALKAFQAVWGEHAVVVS